MNAVQVVSARWNPPFLSLPIRPSTEGVHSGVSLVQAEGGIRDVAVTGVQTCALPIFSSGCEKPSACCYVISDIYCAPCHSAISRWCGYMVRSRRLLFLLPRASKLAYCCAVYSEIGRASCRERV